MSLDNQDISHQKNAVLIFPDGVVFWGFGVGKQATTSGEICFNTSITGYQEILTDPSYAGQIINFTFPHIGNVGVNSQDIEANKVRARGLIIRESITNPSNYRADDHFNQWLINNELTGICGVDTRAITKKIRSDGAKTVAIIFQDLITNEDIAKELVKIKKSTDLSGQELACKVSEGRDYSFERQGVWVQPRNNYQKVKEKKFKVVAIDFGSKLNIIRCLMQVGLDVEVVKADTSFEEIMKYKPDGIFLSNGPGDPMQTAKIVNQVIIKILEQKIPLFGICLGHQLLAIALGAKTHKMSLGHRGANHPVQNIKTKKVEITSQNHGFCVDKNTLPKNVEITHLSLFDNSIEGIRVCDSPAFSVQYHPESSPGPNDSFYLFEEFVELIKKSK